MENSWAKLPADFSELRTSVLLLLLMEEFLESINHPFQRILWIMISFVYGHMCVSVCVHMHRLGKREKVHHVYMSNQVSAKLKIC